MKKLLKRGVPLVMAFFILCGSIFISYTKVQATGITDILYYTYWDLISTVYAQCGYSTTVDADVINNHGVTGKQVWDNFCTSVENTAKFHYGILNDAKEQAIKDLKNLAKTATAKGIKLSQDLYDMLRECLVDTSSIYKNNFDTSSGRSICSFIRSVIGYSGYSSASCVDAIQEGYLLSIVKDGSQYMILYVNPSNRFFIDYRKEYSNDSYLSSYVYNVSSHKYEFCSVGGDAYTVGSDHVYQQTICSVAHEGYQILFKNGSFYTDTTIKAAQVSEGACPQEVPDVTPWTKNPSIPDEWRVVDPNESPDKDPKEDPDILPAVIPFHPLTPDTPDTEKPDSTEEPGQKPDSTENPDKDPDTDPDKKNDPGILINPSTGNYIDPNTGYDIDPKTGKLIDPETGELIEPDLPDSGGGSGGGGGIMDKLANFGDITKLFPFCIPFDLVKLIKGMRAEEAPPVFHYEHYFESIDYTFVVDVDLSDYEKYIKLFRYGMQLGYIVTLMFLTIRISALFT